MQRCRDKCLLTHFVWLCWKMGCSLSGFGFHHSFTAPPSVFERICDHNSHRLAGRHWQRYILSAHFPAATFRHCQMETCRGKWNVSPPHQQYGRDREGWPVGMVAETLCISGGATNGCYLQDQNGVKKYDYRSKYVHNSRFVQQLLGWWHKLIWLDHRL